jgi:hypothetical protein
VERATLHLAGVLVLALAACGGSDEPSQSGELGGDAFGVPAPTAAIADMEMVEDFSEELANRLLELSAALRKRDRDAAAAFLTDGFRGHPFLFNTGGPQPLPLGGQEMTAAIADAPVVDGPGFLNALVTGLEGWQRIDKVLWKVKEAEFEVGSPPPAALWGRARLKISCQGLHAGGGPVALVAWAAVRVEKRRGTWLVDRLALESLTHRSRPTALFTEVSASAGVAHAGARFGTPGNDSFAWNGAACGDVDGDGDFDLFVPSRPRNFLYLAGDAGFDERGADYGVSTPAGGTGAVFADFDGDGRQDLVVADVGWEDEDGRAGGNPLRFYSGAVAGSLVERGAKLGLAARSPAYSLVAFDHDQDGLLDLFVCNYGRMEAEPNDSWIDARNGSPNALYRQLPGGGFRDVAGELGLASDRWTYAAAASDVDRDGRSELYVANDYGPNELWMRAAEGGWFDAAHALGARDPGNGMGAVFGDLTGDGAPDLYVANMASTAGRRILKRLAGDPETRAELGKLAAGNTVLVAEAGPRSVHGPKVSAFERLDSSLGAVEASWAWGAALFDVDLDGRLDVFCANGHVTGDSAKDT